MGLIMSCKVKDVNTDDLKKIIKDSYNITEVLRKLGYTNPRAKHTRDALKKIISKNNIDITHFSQIRGKGNVSFNARYTLEEILVKNSNYKSTRNLKTRLLSEGVIENKCQICGNLAEWQGKVLILHLDHKNGINNDNRLENLRLLCPNCHSQTDTYGGKNAQQNKNKNKEKNQTKKHPKTLICKNCNNEFQASKHSQQFCSPKCWNNYNSKIDITKEELNKLIYIKSFSEIGRMFNVSDNAIRKLCKKYDLPYRKKDMQG